MRRGPLIAAVGTTILVWGFVFIPLKYLTNEAYRDHPFSPGAFLILRFLPLLPIYLILLYRHGSRESRPDVIRNWRWLALMGLLGIPGYHLPLNFALSTSLHTGLISLILSLCPAMTYFLAVVFRQERPRRERSIGVAVAFLGIALIFCEEILSDLRGGTSVVFSWEGVGWMFLSTLSWSISNLIGRRLGRHHDPRFTFAITGAIGTAVVLAASPVLITGETIRAIQHLGHMEVAAWAYVTLLSTLFAYWAWISALRQMEASRLASTANALPLLVHAAAVIFLPEERRAFTAIYLLGAATTIFGMMLVIRRKPEVVSES